MQAQQAEAWLRTFLDYRLFTVGDSVVRVSTLVVLLLSSGATPAGHPGSC